MSRSAPGHLGTQDDVILARVGAFLIDHVLSFVVAVLVPVGLAFLVTPDPTSPLAPLLVYVLAGTAYFSYFIVTEGLFGQTPGKRLTGVIVVGRDGTPVTMKQAAIRNVLRIVDGFFSYAVGLVVMLLGEDRQRVGDLAADTLVVRARR